MKPLPLINTGVSARWKEAVLVDELFQQFLAMPGKPLKWLEFPHFVRHRAKAPVLMRISLA